MPTPVSVPSYDDFSALSERVGDLAEAVEDLQPPAPAPAPEPIVINELPYVAFQKDRTEAALRAAIRDVLATRSGQNCTKIVQMQGGTTIVRDPDLLGSPADGESDLVFGLTLQGIGERMTNLSFQPSGNATDDPTKLNLFTLANRVRDFKIRGMQIGTTNPNASMIWAWSNTKIDGNSVYPEYGVGQNQRFMFENVEWANTWKRVIGIDGDVNTNNNSEWSFDKCNTNTQTRFGEAFLQSGGINGRNHPQMAQYLNFFIKGCNFTYNGGSFFRFIKGGNIHVDGGSWSAATKDNALTWFDLQGAGGDSAAMLTVKGTRFEPKAANQLIIDNSIGSGQVHFQDVIDVSSLQYPAGSAQANYKLHRYTARNGRFPTVTYENCVLAGAHLYTGGNNNAPGKAIYKRSKFYQWTNNNAVASGAGATDGFLQYTNGLPRHRFEDCDGQPDVNYN